MKQVTGILKSANRHSLVLLDELGSGTDPVEGSALAIAILRKLADDAALTFATTHYAGSALRSLPVLACELAVSFSTLEEVVQQQLHARLVLQPC